MLYSMIKCTDTLKSAARLTVDEGVPVSVRLDEDKVFVITEQAFNYMLSKCTEDEVWDLGFLGNSEKHVKKSTMHPKLQNLIQLAKKTINRL